MTPFRFAAVAAVGLAAVACANTPKVTRDQIVTTSACQDTSFPIYFETGSTTLTPAAMEALRLETSRAKRCSIKEVLILGLADADGPANRNLELSRKRATAVAAALAAQGVPAARHDLEAAGESGAVTPGGAPEPLRRRAEVVIRLGPAQAAS